MSRVLKVSILSILVFFSFLAIYGCRGSSSVAYNLDYQQAVLAREGANGKMLVVKDGVFKKGEKVYFVLMNVGKFKQDKDGLNWFDIDVKVTNSDGKVVFVKKNMLGEKGHVKLKDNTAKYPHVFVETPKSAESGKYKMQMRIYDKIGKGMLSVTETFTLQ